MNFHTINPATGQIIKEYTYLTPPEVETKIALSQATFIDWSQTSFATRQKLLLSVAAKLKEDRKSLAQLATQEMGKRLVDGLSEVDKCIWVCEYYARETKKLLAPEIVQTEARKSTIIFTPLGVTLAVMPWNFPYWQVFRAAAPSIMAGNTMLLKHASSVPGCALAIEQIFTQAGAPVGLFQTLLISGSGTEQVVADPRVRLVSLTGSESAGSQVASLAGRHLKRTILELGGSDPFIVMPDADLEYAASTAATARLIVTGQSCIAAKRFIIHQDIAAQFINLFKQNLKSKILGDPQDSSTDVGPLSSDSIRQTLHDQVTRSLAQGATLVTGGTIPQGAGYYYPPTILSEVTLDMPVVREETFGPVAAVMVVKNADEALTIANHSRFGLGSSVWTHDPKLIKLFTANLQAGCVFFNSMVKSDPRLPFGGTKFSGYGRELSTYGLKEFVNIKTIWVN